VNNAVMGAKPGHPFVERALYTLLARFDGTEEANYSSPRLVSELLIQAGLERYDPSPQVIDGVAVLPMEAFYPYDWTERSASGPPLAATYAVHRWAHRW
jgi:hypothetical protein